MQGGGYWGDGRTWGWGRVNQTSSSHLLFSQGSSALIWFLCLGFFWEAGDQKISLQSCWGRWNFNAFVLPFSLCIFRMIIEILALPLHFPIGWAVSLSGFGHLICYVTILPLGRAFFIFYILLGVGVQHPFDFHLSFVSFKLIISKYIYWGLAKPYRIRRFRIKGFLRQHPCLWEAFIFSDIEEGFQ